MMPEPTLRLLKSKEIVEALPEKMSNLHRKSLPPQNTRKSKMVKVKMTVTRPLFKELGWLR